MGKGPGLYPDIGKKARDLLYRDYQSDHKFSLTTYTANGVLKGEETGDVLNGDVKVGGAVTIVSSCL
ncbi:mitochondrial outer membrane protein porin of 36 kDa-like protein [Tanacetum coccineum]